MADIKWIVVEEPTKMGGKEFEFAKAELTRQLPQSVEWLDACATKLQSSDVHDTDLVLVIAHSNITVDARCFSRLSDSLELGFDVVQACDSGNFSPMRPPVYATLRGMERYVDSHGAPRVCCISSSDAAMALLSLMTVNTWKRRQDSAVRVARVVGAYVHDVSSYFSGDRSDVIQLIPKSAQSCLDVGGGLGNFLKLVKAQRGLETCLVEIDPNTAAVARTNQCADFVITGDFLDYSTERKFDCITFLDMLEHVAEPERYLDHSKKFLAEHGCVIASIPNVGHWSVVVDLLEGRWDYVPMGIHCVTHLRFFTLNSILDLFNRSGFEVDRIEPVSIPCPTTWSMDFQKIDSLKLDMSNLNAYAYSIVAKPTQK